ncbi:MAG: hypothetical protein H0W15_03305 [Gemmatimonadales bacterium]|nr:hypothetical protein [Gemmatimonadales bacterium]
MFGSLRVVAVLVGFTMLLTTSGAAAQAPTSGVAVRWHEGATVVRAQVHEPVADGKLIVQRRDGSTVTIDPRTTPMEYRTNGRTKWGSAGIGFGVGAGIDAIAIPAGKWVQVSPGSVTVALAF